MSPRHLKEIQGTRTQTVLRYPVEVKMEILRLIKLGKIKYFNEFVVEAMEHKLKLELRKLKYKGKRNGHGISHT